MPQLHRKEREITQSLRSLTDEQRQRITQMVDALHLKELKDRISRRAKSNT